MLVGAFNDMPVLSTAFHKDKFHNDHIFFSLQVSTSADLPRQIYGGGTLHTHWTEVP